MLGISAYGSFVAWMGDNVRNQNHIWDIGQHVPAWRNDLLLTSANEHPMRLDNEVLTRNGRGSAPLMTLLTAAPWPGVGTIDNYSRVQVDWLYNGIAPQVVSAGGEITQPVMHRQQGVVFAPGYNDRPRSWNPI